LSKSFPQFTLRNQKTKYTIIIESLINRVKIFGAKDIPIFPKVFCFNFLIFDYNFHIFNNFHSKSIDLFSFFNYNEDAKFFKSFFHTCFIIFSYLKTVFFSSAPNRSCNLLF